MCLKADEVLRELGVAVKPTYTVQEAAAILGNSTRTIHRMIEDGRLSAVRPGGHYRITKWALAERLTEI